MWIGLKKDQITSTKYKTKTEDKIQKKKKVLLSEEKGEIVKEADKQPF